MEPGILRNALSSVFLQQGVSVSHVYVIDDESPVPAAAEIIHLPSEWVAAITVIRQKNMGPAGARNSGLNAVAPGTEYVAFLDSDDTWRPDHLKDAIDALSYGLDFYFSDRWILESQLSGSDWRRDKYIPPLTPLIPQRQIFRIEEGFLRLMMSSLVHTSGVVYRYSSLPTYRFQQRFNRAEDYLFFLAILQKVRAAAFCYRPGYDVGRGVSISRSRWGTIENLKGSRDVNRALQCVLRTYELSPTEIAEAHQYYRKSSRDLGTELLHHLMRGRVSHCIPIILSNPFLIKGIGSAVLRRRRKQDSA